MKNLLSLIPVLAFFIAFKMAGDDPNPIVYGTKWLIGSTVAVLLLMLCIYRQLTRMELILGGAVLLFSGLTIAFDNPAFIKWKVSVMNIIYAAVLLSSRYIFRTNLLSLFMHRYLPIKKKEEDACNIALSCNFLLIAAVNYVLAFRLVSLLGCTPAEADSIWMNFRTFGIPVIDVLFFTGLFIYIYRKLPPEMKTPEGVSAEGSGNEVSEKKENTD